MQCLTDFVDVDKQRLLILQALANHNMTQTELAKRINVSHSRISNFLSGHTDLWGINKHKIAQVLGIKLIDTPKELSENITFYRVEKGLKISELAKIIHVHEATLGNYELGKNRPYFDNIIAISKALNVPLESLAYGPEYMEKQKSKTSKILQELLQQAGEMELDFISNDQKQSFIDIFLKEFFNNK